MDNKKIVFLLQKGDQEAFTYIINRYNRQLFSYAVS